MFASCWASASRLIFTKKSYPLFKTMGGIGYRAHRRAVERTSIPVDHKDRKVGGQCRRACRFSSPEMCCVSVTEVLVSTRKLTTYFRLFAANKQPRLSISHRNEVEVDYGGMIQLTTVDDYKRSVRGATWRTVQNYIKDVVDRKLRIVFFSATPQGGGVALMRHALLRFLKCKELM